MELFKYPEAELRRKLFQRPTFDQTSLNENVGRIILNVIQNGDAALREYANEYGEFNGDSLGLSRKEIEEGAKHCPDELKSAIDIAIWNITRFHESQIEKSEMIETTEGVYCWRNSVGIEKVGLYIPGGTAPLFSTLLMLAIPSRLAGCKEIIVCTPCKANQEVHPALLYAAYKTGIHFLFRCGGAQAIAAMAFGTESVPRVYKIFGPGNQYVTAAKQIVTQMGLSIDMPAGPSELAVIADKTAIPSFVAADLLSQAEHGKDSQVILFSDSEELISLVKDELEKQLQSLPRKAIALEALTNGKAILCNSINEAVHFSNEYAPEHLIIACRNDEDLIDSVRNAGSVFLGNYSCESAGDYASGTNHTLPTNGYARAYSGVSLDSFVKKITFQRLTPEGIKKLGPAIERMAEAEGLEAHKNAVSIRLKHLLSETDTTKQLGA